MKKQYIKPAMQVIETDYSEGMMTHISLAVGGTATGPAQAKPGNTWGDLWVDPTSSGTTTTGGTYATSTLNDAWTVN